MTDEAIFFQSTSQRSALADAKEGAGTFVKALTELVTNSYQNYKDHPIADGERQQIRIVADQVGEYFEVIDYGTGIAENVEELKKRLGVYSRLQKDTHTPEGRSMFGRGMSDVLFRQPKYESVIYSHKNGKTMKVRCLWQNNPEHDNEPEKAFLPMTSTQIAKEVMAKLPKHGTYVKFYWKEEAEGTQFPTKGEIRESLSKYYELKNILQDPDIDVMLEYRGLNESKPEKLTFYTYDKTQIGKQLANIPLGIKGHDIQIISATMYRAAPALSHEEGEGRTGGLYIEGEAGQVYDLTLFGYEYRYPSQVIHIVGEVKLSKSAKEYFQHRYNVAGETVVKRNRTGFQKGTAFYNKLQAALDNWIKETIGIEGNQVDRNEQPESIRDGIRELNKIAKEILGKAKEATGPGQDKDKEKKKDELIEMLELRPSNCNVEQDVRTRMKLLINSAKFSAGSKVKLKVSNSRFKHEPEQASVPAPSEGEKIVSIDVYITCSTVGEEGSIRAECVDKNGISQKSPLAFLTCVPEGTEWEPKEHLEFSPQNVTGRPFEEKSVTLWMNANMIKPGDVIQFEFTPAEGQQGGEEAITFTDDASILPDGKQKFGIKVEDSEVLPNSYRKRAIKFMGKKDGFSGVLKATSKEDADISPAICNISIKNIQDEGGMLKDWVARSVEGYDPYAFYEDGNVVFNLSIPMVKRVLGDSHDIARQRCESFEECAMFVGLGITDVFLQEVLIQAYRNRIKNFKSESWEGRMREIVNEKHHLLRQYGKDVLTKFVPKSRQDLEPEEQIIMTLGGNTERKVKVFKSNAVVKLDQRPYADLDIFPKEDVIQKLYGFKVGQAKFTIAVWEYSAKKYYVVELYAYERGGKEDVILRGLQHVTQHFRRPEMRISGIPEDFVFSEVNMAKLVNNKSIETRQLDIDDAMSIPDMPTVNDAGNMCDNNVNWTYPNGRPLVYYEINENVKKKVPNLLMTRRLVCLVPSDRTDIMASMYVRTLIVPLISALEK